MKASSDSKNPKSVSSVKKINSIKTKIVAAAISMAVIPLLIIVSVNFVRTQNEAIKTSKDSLSWSAWYLQSEVKQIMAKNESSLLSLAASSSVRSYLKNGETPETRKDILNQMKAINDTFSDENQIVLSNIEGMMVLRSDEGKCVDISQRDYFIKASKGEINAASVFISGSTKIRNTCLAVPVKDENGDIIGVLHRSYMLSDFHKLLAEDGVEAFMVDGDGTLAAHSDYDISADDEPKSFKQSPYMTSGLESDTYESNATGHTTYVSYVKEPISGYTVCAAVDKNEVLKEARLSALTGIILGLIVLAIVVVFSLIMAKKFTDPIMEVDESLSALADGRFKKIGKYTNRKDEIGHIVRNTDSVIEKLGKIVGYIKESSNTVGHSSEELSLMANQIAATAESVAGAVQEIATGAVQQAEEIQSAAEGSNKITKAVESVQGSSNDVNELAARMKKASEDSSKSLSYLQASSTNMTSKIEEISSKIAATQVAVANINDRVEGISGIASQTNLLSLNASIEAARSGEYGKGFSVVASEIRQLADDSENLAQEIRGVMDSLLSQAQDAVQAAQEIKKGNIEQQEALAKTLTSVQGMLEDIEKTVSGVTVISSDANDCVNSNRLVSDAMSSLTAISEENAASSETTGASVQELSATVSTLAMSATGLRDVAEKLNQEIAFFK